MRLAIDERHVDRREAERPRREQAAEAAAHDHDTVTLVAFAVHRRALLEPAALIEHQQQRQRRKGGTLANTVIAMTQPSVRAPAAAANVSDVVMYGDCATPHAASIRRRRPRPGRVPRMNPLAAAR